MGGKFNKIQWVGTTNRFPSCGVISLINLSRNWAPWRCAAGWCATWRAEKAECRAWKQVGIFAKGRTSHLTHVFANDLYAWWSCIIILIYLHPISRSIPLNFQCSSCDVWKRSFHGKCLVCNCQYVDKKVGLGSIQNEALQQSKDVLVRNISCLFKVCGLLWCTCILCICRLKKMNVKLRQCFCFLNLY